MNPEQRLDRLEQGIATLRVEFEKFFNGAADVPPDDLRDSLRTEIRALRLANLKAAADNFRLAQLEARFNSFNELFNRRLRVAEEGRRPSVRVPRERGFDARRGVVVEGTLDSEVVEGLYAGLSAGKGRGPKFDLDTFRGYLEKQMETIRARTGRQRVRFRVEDDDGRLKLKAKPLAE
ncbi:MAG TPA: hypothetical protein VKU40_16570 [Thermoanaerobaculia bacterium]|nr:hypothetical protein [Thermoanaerobaculia bacterium]